MGDGEGDPTPVEVAGGLALLVAVVGVVVAFVWFAGPRATGPSLHKCEGEGASFSCREACGWSGWRLNESSGRCEAVGMGIGERALSWLLIDSKGEVAAAIGGIVVGALRPWEWVSIDLGAR